MAVILPTSHLNQGHTAITWVSSWSGASWFIQRVYRAVESGGSLLTWHPMICENNRQHLDTL